MNITFLWELLPLVSVCVGLCIFAQQMGVIFRHLGTYMYKYMYCWPKKSVPFVLGSFYMSKNTQVACCNIMLHKFVFNTQFFLWCHLFVSLGFSFIDIDPDPNKVHFERIIIELNGTTNYSISCRTTDVNDITTLFHNSQQLTVGGRITLDKQVFTIHGISSSDFGSYTCKARNGLGTVIEQSAVFIYTERGKPGDK